MLWFSDNCECSDATDFAKVCPEWTPYCTNELYIGFMTSNCPVTCKYVIRLLYPLVCSHVLWIVEKRSLYILADSVCWLCVLALCGGSVWWHCVVALCAGSMWHLCVVALCGGSMGQLYMKALYDSNSSSFYSVFLYLVLQIFPHYAVTSLLRNTSYQCIALKNQANRYLHLSPLTFVCSSLCKKLPDTCL